MEEGYQAINGQEGKERYEEPGRYDHMTIWEKRVMDEKKRKELKELIFRIPPKRR